LFWILSFASIHTFAQKKKKSKGQYEKPNIVKRAWGDLTTRNNYYFNANELYKEIVHNYEFNRTVNYNELVPFYFHDGADFSGNQSDLETIERKTGIVLQLHDYSRWRDNAYLLLGKSQFLRKQYDTALITFQYIVTTMKPGKLNLKLEFSNKDRLKYIRKRQKEIEKAAGKKKSIIEFQYKKAQEEAKEKAETAREKQQAAIDKKKKEIEEIIKAKKKIIALQKKGKKIPPELLAKAKGKSNKIDSTLIPQKTKKTDKPNFDPKLPYVLMGDQYVKNPYYKDSMDRSKDAPLKELSKKEDAKFDKLTFWEKIKHKLSRPEAITWMAKCLIEKENYADAKSIISYGKALRKLTKKQRRDFYLVDAYYNTRRNDLSPAIEQLENAMLYFKKKKQKAYYEYLLAQLYERNNQPADAVDYYKKAGKHTKDEELNLFAQIQLAKLFGKNPDLADQDIVKMLAKLIKFGKNKDHADEVLFTIANYYYFQNDTAQAIAYLQKSIKKSISNNEQKGKSYLKLGEIFFDKEEYFQSSYFYDSAIAYLPNTYENYEKIVSRKSTLTELASNFETIHVQDSLQRLGKMSPKELAAYIVDVQAKQEKDAKKKSRFGSDDGGYRGSTSGPIALDAVSNGLWYFYNPDAKARGFNDFRAIWGDRPLEDNWRRRDKGISLDNINTALPTTDNDTATIKKVKKLTASNDSLLKIPKTPEDFMASDKKIAEALFSSGEIFKNKLNNLPKSKIQFDELTRRFSNSEYDARAHYYQYLIYLDKNLTGLADKEKTYILENYPMSEVAEVLKKRDAPDAASASETSEKFYASTYQLFQNGNYDDVIKNNSLARIKYPSANEIPQFEFLSAVSFGKKKMYADYKTALMNIISKYPTGDVKEKAQQYLVSFIQFESNLKDTTPAPVIIKDTVPKAAFDSTKDFTVDTTGLTILIELKDPYLKITDIISSIGKFNKKHFSDDKIKVAAVFVEGSPFIQIKRFEGITDANKYSEKIQSVPAEILGAGNEFKADYYTITPANFRKIKKLSDLKTYSRFYFENYNK
jgi:tetratricopeptide (TPR) repeat protein